eukprot:TRINITY_DN826_c0_g2_i3.p1 TRINITY_DN826_c0_g2~~TRINITY_DN826_c0_g2_i3.p1  ORF type:complete len:272 (+),score=40.17 TRINITY_DN826_c0_g2_i3:87-902(+)
MQIQNLENPLALFASLLYQVSATARSSQAFHPPTVYPFLSNPQLKSIPIVQRNEERPIEKHTENELVPNPLFYAKAMNLASSEEQEHESGSLPKEHSRKRGKPGLSNEEQAVKKKLRLERNKISARMSRKKKKAFLEMLNNQVEYDVIAQVVLLKEELSLCKSRLNQYENASGNCPGESSQLQRLKKEVQAAKYESLEDKTKTLSILNKFSEDAEKRVTEAAENIRRALDVVLPSPFSFLLNDFQQSQGADELRDGSPVHSVSAKSLRAMN